LLRATDIVKIRKMSQKNAMISHQINFTVSLLSRLFLARDLGDLLGLRAPANHSKWMKIQPAHHPGLRAPVE
jgi:hypothetical protein